MPLKKRRTSDHVYKDMSMLTSTYKHFWHWKEVKKLFTFFHVHCAVVFLILVGNWTYSRIIYTESGTNIGSVVKHLAQHMLLNYMNLSIVASEYIGAKNARRSFISKAY